MESMKTFHKVYDFVDNVFAQYVYSVPYYDGSFWGVNF